MLCKSPGLTLCGWQGYKYKPSINKQTVPLPQKRDSEIARQMKEQNDRASVAERERELERYKEMVRYQQELERQLEEQEQKKQQAYEEFLKEKLMIDEIVRKIYEEDQR